MRSAERRQLCLQGRFHDHQSLPSSVHSIVNQAVCYMRWKSAADETSGSTCRWQQCGEEAMSAILPELVNKHLKVSIQQKARVQACQHWLLPRLDCLLVVDLHT